MKFISLGKLATDAAATFKRFPLVILSGLAGSIAVISETEDERYVMIPFLGIGLLFALTLIAERKSWNRLLVGALGIVLLVLYFFALGTLDDTVDRIRFFLYAIGIHLLAAFAPYLVRNQINGFWQYNKTLFLRSLITALYTAVLYAGLALALAAIDNLFDIAIDNQVYADLAAILGGVFATWFFLAGVPADFDALEQVESYPTGLKIFTQYVLLPLVTIYIIILYLYAGKIIINWEWPIGWVSSLILGFAVAGILSFLLLYPIRNKEGNRWIREFSKWFYWSLVPLVVLLGLAIGRRIIDYGFTESRYYVAGLAIWLGAITLYFIISRRDNIKVIPITLCVFAFLTSFGPWGAFDVSIRSQVERLRNFLTEQKMLVDGKVRPIDDPQRDREGRLRSIVDFLADRDALDEIAPWYPDTVGSLDRYTALSALGLDYGAMRSDYSFNLEANDDSLLDVRGYDYYVPFTSVYRDGRSERYESLGRGVAVKYDSTGKLDILHGDRSFATFDLNAFAGRLYDSLSKAGGGSDPSPDAPLGMSDLPQDVLALRDGSNGGSARIYIKRISGGGMRSGAPTIHAFDAMIFVTLPPDTTSLR